MGDVVDAQQIIAKLPDTLTFDPPTTYVFDKDSTTLSVKREFQGPPSTALQRDRVDVRDHREGSLGVQIGNDNGGRDDAQKPSVHEVTPEAPLAFSATDEIRGKAMTNGRKWALLDSNQ